MIRASFALVLVLGAALASRAIAQGVYPELGRDLAAACASCHGTNEASQPGMPSLAGRPRTLLVKHMQEFRAGKRPATVMQQIARGYSDEQIEALAAYLSAQKAR